MAFKIRYLKNVLRVGIFTVRGVFSRWDQRQPVVFIDARFMDFGRRLLLVVRLIQSAGYRVAIRANIRSWLKAGKNGRRIFDDPQVCLVLGMPKTAVAAIQGEAAGTIPKAKIIHLSFDVFNNMPTRNQVLFFPIMFHPAFLESSNLKKINAMVLPKERSIRLFFAGKWQKKDYDRPETEELFGVITRYRFMQIIRDNFGPESLVLPESLVNLRLVSKIAGTAGK